MKNKKQINGFTLLEMMVALAIFLTVSLIATSIFLMTIKNQRKAFVAQNLQENGRYIIEAISKEIRMSSIDTFVPPELGAIPSSLLKIKTYNVSAPGGMDVYYRFGQDVNGHYVIQRSENDESNYQSINSGQVEVEGEFYIAKYVSSQGAQPRVTIKLILRPADASEPMIKIQNTITSRIYQDG
jgi:prepilin-type N-terminal cleavage/methylation domain-containing protein